MKYENLNPEQKAEFDELRDLFEQFTRAAGKMNATLYPETLSGFTDHAAKAEMLLEKIVTKTMENKIIIELSN